MAVVSDVEAVLDFLRKNGFKEAESALKQDVIEKFEFGSFDYEKFLFPMPPLPPPVRILPNSRPLRVEDCGDCDRSSSADSHDEFVSLESSTGDACSSEFTNPYGRNSTSRANSDSSSDRLSQFGTARDYHDIDMQNDLYWYHDKDEGEFMTPCFGGMEFFGNPSEDKFVTISESEKEYDNSSNFYDKLDGFQTATSANYLDKQCLFSTSPMDDISDGQITKYYHLDEKIKHGNGFEREPEGCAAYNCSAPFCKCCGGGGGFCDGDPVDYNDLSLSKTDLNDSRFNIVGEFPSEYVSAPVRIINDYSVETGSANDLAKGFDRTFDLHKEVAEELSVPISTDSYEVGDHREVSGELNGSDAAANEADAAEDELLMYKTQEDEYEIFDLRIVHRKNRTGFEENKDLPIMLNTVIASRYYVTEYLGSAAFSKVFQALDLHTGIDVCLKIIKNDKDFFDQSLDEIKLLKLVNKHDPSDEWHILRLYDFFYHQEHLFIVCELLRANLYEFLKFNQESGEEPYFTLPRLQVITRQCLEALNYMHHLGIIHCDLKPENILIKSYRRCEIKVIDLGSSCFLTDNLCLYVQSRSYRAPEVILGLPYDQKIDIWSLGCILAELCSGEVLFPNDAIVTILARMIAMLGSIDLEMLVKGQETYKYFTKEYDLYQMNEGTNQMEYIIPEESSLEQHLQVYDVKFIDFLRNLLEINPQRRPTASKALNHPWLSHSY